MDIIILLFSICNRPENCDTSKNKAVVGYGTILNSSFHHFKQFLLFSLDQLGHPRTNELFFDRPRAQRNRAQGIGFNKLRRP